MFVVLKGKKGRDGARKKRNYKKEKVRKPKPVDEDLYKIPPQLLYQLPKKASKFFSYSQSEYVGKHYSFSDFGEYHSLTHSLSLCRRSCGIFAQGVAASTALHDWELLLEKKRVAS